MKYSYKNYNELIKSAGFERATQMFMTETVERLNNCSKDVEECGRQILQMAELLGQLSTVAENMKHTAEELTRRMKGDEELPGVHGDLN